jgi:hypothetical protein
MMWVSKGYARDDSLAWKPYKFIDKTTKVFVEACWYKCGTMKLPFYRYLRWVRGSQDMLDWLNKRVRDVYSERDEARAAARAQEAAYKFLPTAVANRTATVATLKIAKAAAKQSDAAMEKAATTACERVNLANSKSQAAFKRQVEVWDAKRAANAAQKQLDDTAALVHIDDRHAKKT